MIELAVAYLAVINIIAFVVCGIDKRSAKHNKRRTPEKVLFLLAFLFGSLGMWTGMLFFRHKTKHWYFVLFIPVILIIQAAVFVFAIKNNLLIW